MGWSLYCASPLIEPGNAGHAEQALTHLSEKYGAGGMPVGSLVKGVAPRRRQAVCVSTSDRPKGGQDWGRAKVLVWFGVLRSLTFQAQDRPAHTSDTTNTIRL